MEKPIRPKKPTFPLLPIPTKQYVGKIYIMQDGKGEYKTFSEKEYQEMVCKNVCPELYTVDSIPSETLNQLIEPYGNVIIYISHWEEAGADLCFRITQTLSDEEFKAEQQKYFIELDRRKEVMAQYALDIAEHSKQKALYDYEIACLKMQQIGV